MCLCLCEQDASIKLHEMNCPSVNQRELWSMSSSIRPEPRGFAVTFSTFHCTQLSRSLTPLFIPLPSYFSHFLCRPPSVSLLSLVILLIQNASRYFTVSRELMTCPLSLSLLFICVLHLYSLPQGWSDDNVSLHSTNGAISSI